MFDFSIPFWDDLFSYIFEFCSINDLFNIRLVSRRIKDLVKERSVCHEEFISPPNESTKLECCTRFSCFRFTKITLNTDRDILSNFLSNMHVQCGALKVLNVNAYGQISTMNKFMERFLQCNAPRLKTLSVNFGLDSNTLSKQKLCFDKIVESILSNLIKIITKNPIKNFDLCELNYRFMNSIGEIKCNLHNEFKQFLSQHEFDHVKITKCIFQENNFIPDINTIMLSIHQKSSSIEDQNSMTGKLNAIANKKLKCLVLHINFEYTEIIRLSYVWRNHIQSKMMRNVIKKQSELIILRLSCVMIGHALDFENPYNIKIIIEKCSLFARAIESLANTKSTSLEIMGPLAVHLNVINDDYKNRMNIIWNNFTKLSERKFFKVKEVYFIPMSQEMYDYAKENFVMEGCKIHVRKSVYYFRA